MTSSLIIFSKAALMLAEADTIQKAKELKSLALTAAEWAKRKNMGEDAIQHCRSYALEAERKMGQMLKETERAPRGGDRKSDQKSPRVTIDLERPTLASIGLTKRESAEAQMMADLSAEEFEEIKAGKKTRIQAKREKKEKKRGERRRENAERIGKSPSIGSIDGAFSTIVIDPPWDWGDEGDVDQLGRARPDYATLGIEELMALPVSKLADKDAHIYLWITNRSMPKGFKLLESWGFRHVTMLTWPKPSFGMGNYFRGQTEHVLFGVRGSQPLKRKNASTLLPAWKRGPKGHSSKPVEFLEFVESCSPGPYLEMFSRSQRDGWVTWGESA
jgi:N6-adenosine-specific RNA methylase IME4